MRSNLKLFLSSLAMLLTHLVSAQLPGPAPTDSLSPLVTQLSRKYQFVLAYKEESYWWSNRHYYKILARNGDKWDAIQVIQTFNKRGKSTVESNTVRFNPDSAGRLLEQLKKFEFGHPGNEPGKLQLEDGINYRFEMITNDGNKVVQFYEPDLYLQKFPEAKFVKVFIEWRNLFLDTWKRNL